MSRNEYNKLIGDAGEKVVLSLLKTLNRPVIMSDNFYDAEKDMSCDGKKIEIKTEQPYVKKNAFTFHKNQLEKCTSVDELYVVSIPPRINLNYKHGGKVFIPNLFEYFEYTSNNKPMIGIPIEQASVIEIARLPAHKIEWFNQHTISKY